MRVNNYLYRAFQSEGGAKELRVNNLQNWFTMKIKACREDMLDFQFHSMKRYAIYNIITAITISLQSLIVLLILSRGYIGGDISIAEFTMYFGAVSSITAILSSITDQIGSFKQQILNANDLKKIMNITVNENNVINSLKLISNSSGIIFHNVSFIYPNTNKMVLENINLKILNNDKLVLVGYNGAGKTTLIKLLCKFYRPTSGYITLDGIDIWTISNDEYYKKIGVVFQDFMNFSFSIKENVTMSESGNVTKLSNILNQVGLDSYALNLPNGYDTYISKNFDSSGVELSGGQGQKVAIARAIYKNTPILILDEPTANLDPKSECDIYENLFQMANDKTTIFISHRLAASTIADHIAVFSDGRLEEYGSHQELIKKNGIYADMYYKQSKPYITEKKIF